MIDELLGGQVANTVFQSEVYFFTLFVYLYDALFGLGRPLARRQARKRPRGLSESFSA